MLSDERRQRVRDQPTYMLAPRRETSCAMRTTSIPRNTRSRCARKHAKMTQTRRPHVLPETRVCSYLVWHAAARLARLCRSITANAENAANWFVVYRMPYHAQRVRRRHTIRCPRILDHVHYAQHALNFTRQWLICRPAPVYGRHVCLRRAPSVVCTLLNCHHFAHHATICHRAICLVRCYWRARYGNRKEWPKYKEKARYAAKESERNA